MSEFTRLREAVDAAAHRAQQPELAELRRRASRRGRRRAATVAVGAVVVIAAAAVLAPRLDGDRHPSPAGPPTPTPSINEDAAQIIAQGNLASYGADAAGPVLTVWTTCGDTQPDCGSAWRLGAGAQPTAAGLVRPGVSSPNVYSSGGGFVLRSDQPLEPGIFVAANGSTTSLTQDCADDSWPTTVQPGRYVVAYGMLAPDLVDTAAGTLCDTISFDARTLTEGEYADDGTLWGLVDAVGGPAAAAVGRYDGVRWDYHDLPSGADNNALAVAGSHVAVLQGAGGTGPYSSPEAVGLSVTTDAGATWSEVGAEELPFEEYDSIAFAGTSALFVADPAGDLWLSTDWASFSRVESPEPVSGLEPAGDAVIARLGSSDADALVLITADGTIEPLALR